MVIPNLKTCYFEASEDIMIKFKSQGLYSKRIKYWNPSGNGPPPSLIPTLWKIGILNYEQGKLRKHLQNSVEGTKLVLIILYNIWLNFSEATMEADVAKGRRDWAFSERDKVVLERESIRTLCDKLRRERDRYYIFLLFE